MTDQERDFLARWRLEQHLYAAWGQYLVGQLSERLAKIIDPVSLELFLKIPAKWRIKDETSLFQKAFRRKKVYKDPYTQIEDKIGLRLVALLSDDVRMIERAILDEDAPWHALMARDYAIEREASPYEFQYQSLHYILRSKTIIEFNELEIPAEIPCEVQVRALLQHAYSELTHDTIYKPTVVASPALKRAAAKSMALIEATDDYFLEVSRKIKQEERRFSLIKSVVSKYVQSKLSFQPADTPLNALLIDFYQKFADENFEEEFEKFITEKSFIIERLRERIGFDPTYRVPAMLLVYYCVSKKPHLAAIESPLTDTELEPIYSDLGLSMSFY